MPTHTLTHTPTPSQEASYILPCKIESLTGEKAESAKKMLDRLKGLLQKLPYENYITLAKLLYHLNRLANKVVSSYTAEDVPTSTLVYGDWY